MLVLQKKSGSDPGGSAMRKSAMAVKVAAKVRETAAMADFMMVRPLVEYR
jgi:hypothetical protein